MVLFNKASNRNFLLISYKLLHDTLFILLAFFALALLAEGVLPGIIASHFGLPKIVILVLGNVFLITLLGNFLKIESAPKALNKKMIFLISFLGITLILNSLLEISLIINLLITTLAIGMAYIFYTIFLQEN